MKNTKNSKVFYNCSKLQLVFTLIVLLEAVGIGIYIHYSDTKKVFQQSSHLKYWTMTLSEWNPKGNLRSVKRVFDRLGHQMVNGSEESWDVLWSLEFPYDNFPEKLKDLKPHQRINHIPGMTFLTNKKFMAVSTQSKYVPVSFEFPRLKNEFLYYQKMDLSKQFVVKNFDNRGVNIVTFDEIDFQVNYVFPVEIVCYHFCLFSDGRKTVRHQTERSSFLFKRFP